MTDIWSSRWAVHSIKLPAGPPTLAYVTAPRLREKWTMNRNVWLDVTWCPHQRPHQPGCLLFWLGCEHRLPYGRADGGPTYHELVSSWWTRTPATWRYSPQLDSWLTFIQHLAVYLNIINIFSPPWSNLFLFTIVNYKVSDNEGIRNCLTACVVGLTSLHMCVIVLEQSQVETMSWILSRLYFTIRC